MESLKIFDDFKFSGLDEDWIQSVWDTEFMIYNEPPDEYLMFLESEDMRLLLHETYINVKAWLDEGNSLPNSERCCTEVSWNTLIVVDVKVRALLAILGYIIKSCQSKDADENSRLSCLYAINLYFILLAVPGSSAFNIFHPNLYQQTIDTLKSNSEQLQPPVKKRNKAITFDDLNITEESPYDYFLSPSEKKILVKNMNLVICNFIFMIKYFSFKDHVQSLDITVNGLLEVAKAESDYIGSQCSGGEKGTLEVSLSQNVYAALQELCDNKHGPVKVTITLIAKYILPCLLFSPMDALVKFITNLRENNINFLKDLLYTHEKEAKSIIMILIQQMMLKCPDRTEARQKQASVLIKLFGICKQNILLEAFKNVILLSHHCKIPYRIFAQEIIGKLLMDSFILDCNLTASLKIKAKKLLFAVALNRCMDSSNMVRGKAIAVIAEFTESNNDTDKIIFQSMFDESNQNKKLLTIQDLKTALFDDIDLLPGSNVLISMLTELIEDERAMVRRSTLQILKNLTLMFPNLTNDAVPIISRRCRDPTLMVRRFAVQVLSQLLQHFSDNSQLLDEWVQTVVPQIFDIEVKVQEKVLEFLRELLLDRIVDLSATSDNLSNSLPWRILTVLTNMKMRKHLSKACSLWIKNGVITNSVVKKIQSHIGTCNNIGAWIFLAALAENTKLPNMTKYISNYKEILEENDFHTSLVLQVIRCSWQSLDNEVLENLHAYLYKYLQQFKFNFSLISICLDIMHNIILYLNPDKNSKLLEANILNLIKISETEIKNIFENRNQTVEAASNYVRAMFTLGHATLLCTHKISPLTIRILEGILLEWEALPGGVKEMKELQASATVILGQQAMRDREVAKEVVPIFGRLMRQEANLGSVVQTAVKINAAKALADICVRFTALVEPYLSDICVSMKDSNPRVREIIMVIFIQLLLEDFIKIKGPFFFHILTMLSDSDNMIRELTTFLIEEKLLTKNKTLISQLFLQSIYHYNNYESQHKVYNQRMRDKERKALTLPGKRNETKRKTIYDFMLDHLDPPGKIKLLVKITSQIFGGACANAIDIRKEEGACVLRDALYIISNDRLRPSTFNKHCDDDQQEHEETTVQVNSSANNAINIIIEGMKKHGLDVLLPMLMKLRMKLSDLKSPLENDVKKLLVKAYSEYNKDQLSNLLSEYPTLEKEIEQFKKQEEITNTDQDVSSDEDLVDTNIHVEYEKTTETSPFSNSYPKVVVERISCSQLSRSTSTNLNSPFSPISFIENWNVRTCSTPILKSPLPSEPGPSTSTPKHEDRVLRTKKLSAYFRDREKSNSFDHGTICNISRIQDDSESD